MSPDISQASFLPAPSDQMSKASLVRLDAELADRTQHAIIGRRLLDQTTDRGIDIEQRRSSFAPSPNGTAQAPATMSGFSPLCICRVGIFAVAVLGNLAVLDIGAQAHAVSTHRAGGPQPD